MIQQGVLTKTVLTCTARQDNKAGQFCVSPKLIKKLKLKPADLIRLKEAKAKTLCIELIEDDDALLNILNEHPELMERPVVVAGNQAVIARPPEKLLECLDEQ